MPACGRLRRLRDKLSDVQILLPPSEGKSAPPADTSSVNFDALLAPGLRSARKTVLAALGKACATDPVAATAQLKLGTRLGAYLDINQHLLAASTAPAWRVYTGVLFDALGYGDLGDAGRGHVLIFSGLWGILRPEDEIPDYRCPAGARLPDLNASAAAYWRPYLGGVLPELVDGEFLVDLRSQDYKSMWRPSGPRAIVRVLHERTENGQVTRSVVSHFNKATKGRLAADLLASGDVPTSVVELLDALRSLKYRAEQSGPHQVDVITTTL